MGGSLAGCSGSRFFMRVQLSCWPGLWSHWKAHRGSRGIHFQAHSHGSGWIWGHTDISTEQLTTWHLLPRSEGEQERASAHCHILCARCSCGVCTHWIASRHGGLWLRQSSNGIASCPSPKSLIILSWQMECRDWETRQQNGYPWVVKLLIFFSMNVLSKK